MIAVVVVSAVDSAVEKAVVSEAKPAVASSVNVTSEQESKQVGLSDLTSRLHLAVNSSVGSDVEQPVVSVTAQPADPSEPVPPQFTTCCLVWNGRRPRRDPG